jgi:hypothetical protein
LEKRELLKSPLEIGWMDITYNDISYVRGGYISATHKKGKKDEYGNYRGITVLNNFSRLYGKIIKYFLEQEFSHMETEEQAGFMAGRSTIDHVFCLKQLIAKKMSVDQPLHLLFVDLEKT